MSNTAESAPADAIRRSGARPFFRGCALGCLLPLVVLFLVGWIALFVINHPKLNAAHVTRVDVTLRLQDKGDTKFLGSITNTAALRQLLSVMADSSSSMDHKCSEAGWFVIHYDDGKTRRIDFLPGHHLEGYEYRAGLGVRRMNRGEFLHSLHAAGIATNGFPQLDE